MNPRHCNRLILDSTRVGWPVWWRVVGAQGAEGEAFVGERVVEGVFVGDVDEGVAVELGWD